MKRMAATRKCSSDELLQMPDEGLGFEIVDGELRERTVSKSPSRVAGEVYAKLHAYCSLRNPGWLFPEGG
jgi:hypothetical protein